MARHLNFRPKKNILILSLLLLLQSGCGLFFKSSEERYMRKQRRVMEKQARKDYKEQQNKHWEMQAEDTQEMMKNTKKMSKRNNTVRKKGFLRRFKKCNKSGIDN